MASNGCCTQQVGVTTSQHTFVQGFARLASDLVASCAPITWAATIALDGLRDHPFDACRAPVGLVYGGLPARSPLTDRPKVPSSTRTIWPASSSAMRDISAAGRSGDRGVTANRSGRSQIAGRERPSGRSAHQTSVANRGWAVIPPVPPPLPAFAACQGRMRSMLRRPVAPAARPLRAPGSSRYRHRIIRWVRGRSSHKRRTSRRRLLYR